MELGRAAIVSLVELTIDFLLSIINAVLTTKQQGHTHTWKRTPHMHRCGFCRREGVALWKGELLQWRKHESNIRNIKYAKQTELNM